MGIILGTALALLLSAISMPLILKVAHSRKLYDGIDERTIHSGNIPRLGGVGIFLAFAISLALASLVFKSSLNIGSRLWPLFVCTLVVHAVGLIDDLRDLRARYKFLIELAASLLLVFLGFRFLSIPYIFNEANPSLSFLSYPLTVIWIIGITNALNLIDGMDGLAGGISAFAAATFGLIFLFRGDSGAAVACFILLGALLGFLAFNLPPARIFMGDSGALFLGFILSMLPFMGVASSGAEIGLMPAITVLLIPIFDTFSAIIRRRRAGVSAFTPDKLHLHHKLLDLGLDVKGALAIIYGAQALLCIVALTGLVLPRNISNLINLVIWLVYAVLFCVLSAVARRRGAA